MKRLQNLFRVSALKAFFAAAVFCVMTIPALAADTNSPAEKLLRRGHELEKNGDAHGAFQAYRESAELGSAFAMAEVYLCYWEAKGVAADRATAMEWLKKSTDANNPFGECLMGYRCETIEWEGEGAARHLTKADFPGALRWYRLSAEQDWAGGQYHLGLFFLEGKVVSQDETRGLDLIRAAADKGLRPALEELADLYARGVGEPRHDGERPVALLERAGEWEKLQFRCEHGFGTHRDLVQAARCYGKLSLAGGYYHSPGDLVDKIEFHPPGVDASGTPILQPADRHVTILGLPHPADGPSEDVRRVLSLYLKAARGDGAAAYHLANFYLTGKDVPKSAPSAWAWFNVAAKNGITAAREKISGLEKNLTGDELKSSQQRLATITTDLRAAAVALP